MWMASKQRALNVTIKNWRAVVSHLEDASARGTGDESATAKGLLRVHFLQVGIISSLPSRSHGLTH